MPPRPFWSDPWAWLAAASVIPLVLHSWGAPLGEPVAEDFDFLHHVLLLGKRSLLDGGGSLAFWRPVAHQLYYLAFGPLMLFAPRAVAAIHVALLAVCALALYAALRRTWPPAWAAWAASFPFVAESTRTLISWPSHFVDLGSLLFAALALHEASRRRFATCLLALLASLLCKELGLAAALLIPLLPDREPGERPWRLRFALGTGVTSLAWALLYLTIRKSAGLELPHHLESGLASGAVPMTTRLSWSFVNSLRAIFSLPATHVAREEVYGAALAVLGLCAVSCFAFSKAARARLASRVAWIGWGLAWFGLASAALVTIHPFWAPNRSLFGSVGLGIALAGLVGAAHPLLLAALLALRLAGFALSPGAPPRVAEQAPETGAFMDFERLTRLQRFMEDTRTTLKRSFPTLPRGAHVGQNNLPRGTVYALGGHRALQVWYGDTTLRWVSFDEYQDGRDARLATIVQYQPLKSPEVALVSPASMAAMIRGTSRILAGQWEGALAEFTAAESLQVGPDAVVHLGTVVAKRAVCFLVLRRFDEAQREAERALGLWRNNFDSHYVMAAVAFERGDLTAAAAQLDTLLKAAPQDPGGLELKGRVRAAEARGPLTGRATELHTQ